MSINIQKDDEKKVNIIEAINYIQLIELDKKELYRLLEKSKFNTSLIISRLQELKTKEE